MNEVSELLVRDIMVPHPVALAPATTVANAARIMSQQNIGAVVVASDSGVEGMFTERDLLRRASEWREDWGSTPISQLMTAHPITVPPDVPWPDAMAIMDARRIRHLPVVDHGKLVGMLSVRDVLRHRTGYLDALVRDRTAELVKRNAELTERDQEITTNLNVAAKIQKRLLPHKPPQFQPFQFAIAFQAHDLVTGDYYDFLPIGPDRMGVLIADASGHGVPAAFVSLMAKMCCSAYCQGIDSPAAILHTMNEHLGDLVKSEHFVTMFAAVLDRSNLELSYARAGHPLPFLYRASTRQVTALDVPGVMLGVMPDPAFEDRRTRLEPGDKLLLFTDGVSECRDAHDQELGTEWLESFLRREGHRPAPELLRTLKDELDRFRDGREFEDDVTVIVIEVGPSTQ